MTRKDRKIDSKKWGNRGKQREEKRSRGGQYIADEGEYEDFDDQWIHDFLHHRERKWKKSTIDHDKTVLGKHLPFLGTEVIKANYRDVYDFIEEVALDGVAENTLKQHISVISKLHEHLNAHFNAGMPSVRGISAEQLHIGTSEFERTPMSKDEVRQLIEGAETGSNAYRDTFLISFLYYTGCRRQEASDLQLNHIRPEKGYIIIESGKGDKRRKLPFPKQLKPSYKLWIEAHRLEYATAKESPYLFVSRASKQLSGESIYYAVMNAAENAGIQDVLGENSRGDNIYRIKPHILRHTHATHMDDEVEVKHIQQILGHESPATTEIYISESSNESLEAYRRGYSEL